MSCEYLFQRNREIASGWEGGRSPQQGQCRAGAWGAQSPLERGDLFELQNKGSDSCNARALSSNFINVKRVFSKIITLTGVFPLQVFHVLMKGTSAHGSGQGLNPPES